MMDIARKPEIALAVILNPCQQVEHVAAKLNDFADNNMHQVINLARFLFTWTIRPSEKRARHLGRNVLFPIMNNIFS
jgi:hypothetical protein